MKLRELNKEWIDVHVQKPDYYKNVMVIDKGNIYHNFHRLSDGESEYYGSLETDKILTEVSHWKHIKDN